MGFIEGTWDFLIHPFYWSSYYGVEARKIIIIYLDPRNYFIFKYISMVNIFLFNTCYYPYLTVIFLFKNLICSPIIFLSYIFFGLKSLIYGTFLICGIFFINKCYMIYDIIIQASLPLYQLVPGMPRIYYLIHTSILHGVILPLFDLAAASHGNYIEFIWSLIPSERDILI